LPFRVEDADYHIGASIGITVFPKANETEDDLLREADTAMYRAKEGGRNAVVYFETAMQESVQARMALEQDLHHAIAQNELRLFLQPQVDCKVGLVGAEALVRWQHPTRGLISPLAFIPVAEESGLIVGLGEWVLTEAARILKECDDLGRPLRLAVNVSPRQFRHSGFVAQVRNILRQAGADPTHLVLEVTEGLVIEDIHETIAKMEELNELGIRFSIDDFGTGYSSLAYLKRLPLQELKIDRTFIQDAYNNPNDAALVDTILSVAHHLNLSVVAEGVENEAQFAFLQARHCSGFQGYLFDRPMPWDEFKEKWRG
jgi:EAL domain-containing protein (putative c-di-GMP-specific phosphodiesterase class I)